ncbi:MAG: hypothetical protein RLW61_05795 [Gammaproteobacteria bacterium]
MGITIMDAGTAARQGDLTAPGIAAPLGTTDEADIEAFITIGENHGDRSVAGRGTESGGDVVARDEGGADVGKGQHRASVAGTPRSVKRARALMTLPRRATARTCPYRQ